MDKNRLRRYGYNLMSLASIAQFVVVVNWLFHLFLLAAVTGTTGTAHITRAELPIHFFGVTVIRLAPAADATPFGWFALALLPSLIALWWPWLQVRRFGKTLYYNAPLSAPVANSLQWLGYSLSGSAALTVVITPLVIGWLTAGQAVGTGITSLFFVQLVAAICAFSMALIVREATRVADENKEFV